MDAGALVSGDQLHGVAHLVQRLEAQEVELDEADALGGLHLELHDRAPLGAVAVQRRELAPSGRSATTTPAACTPVCRVMPSMEREARSSDAPHPAVTLVASRESASSFVGGLQRDAELVRG
jgi:hypothetical protein